MYTPINSHVHKACHFHQDYLWHGWKGNPIHWIETLAAPLRIWPPLPDKPDLGCASIISPHMWEKVELGTWWFSLFLTPAQMVIDVFQALFEKCSHLQCRFARPHKEKRELVVPRKGQTPLAGVCVDVPLSWFSVTASWLTEAGRAYLPGWPLQGRSEVCTLVKSNAPGRTDKLSPTIDTIV